MTERGAAQTIILISLVCFALMLRSSYVMAEADKAKPRDYGVSEGERRDSGDPLIVGQFVFGQRCGTCHAKTANGSRAYGPHLAGIVGRKIGATEWPKQSQVLNTAGGFWTESKLDKLLTDPQRSYPGINKTTQVRFNKSRKALLAYLKSL